MYLIPHNSSRRNKRVLLVGGSVVLGVVLLMYFLIPNVFSGAMTAFAEPFWRMTFSAQSGAFRSNAALMQENEDLRRAQTDYDVRLASVRALELENSELKKILGRDASFSTTSASTVHKGEILAAVLKRPPLLAYDELVLDVGTGDGVAVGNSVYAPGRVLVGRVESVGASTARVILYSSPGKQYEVMIGPQHISASAHGRGGGQYEAEVARDSSVTEGDFVEIPSLADKPFGTVTTVISDPTQPFKTILFAPMVNVYQLRWVIVQTKNHE